jgi:hypothetical protein
MMGKAKHTQAVVVIHGIGEQRPMDTVRGFVDAVLPDTEWGQKYFSKPDKMSESFELRKLQDRNRPRTHFYEFYWADKVEGTSLHHIWTWFRSLLFTWPPKHLFSLWLTTWILTIIIVFSLGTGLLGDLTSSIQGLSFVIAGIGTVLWAFLQFFVIYYIGDAARYLSASPKNIAMRRAIRSEGVKLLKNINEGSYDRVIIVGHSLGSVIAYDILKYLWQEYYRTYQTPKVHDQPAIKAVEQAGELLPSEEKDAQKITDFQDLQVNLWKEMSDLGNPWKITDLITLGSPLAHAALLLARGKDDLEKRQRQRDLPKCPPIPEETAGPEEKKYSFEGWEPYKINETESVKLRVFHHAAHFAFTRWTNIYFPAHCGLFGDLVGGPLQKWFGSGIRDIPVTTSRWKGLARFSLIAHTSYWWKNKKDRSSLEKKSDNALGPALEALVEALNLKGKKVYMDPDA